MALAFWKKKRSGPKACVFGVDGLPHTLLTRLMDDDVMPRAKEIFGADEAWPIGEMERRLGELLVGRKRLYYRFGLRPEQDALVLRVLTTLRRTQRAESIPALIADSGMLIHPLRLIKSEAEIALIRKAVRIAVEAFQRVIRETKVGMMEFEVEAMLHETYRSRGCDGPSFPTIAAAGANATAGCLQKIVSPPRR